MRTGRDGAAGGMAQVPQARHVAYRQERERRIHHFLLGLVGIAVGTWLMVVAWVFAIIASDQSVSRVMVRLLG